MTQEIHLTWADVSLQADLVSDRWCFNREITGVYGIPRGGAVPAVLVAERLGLPVVDEPSPSTLIIDDLVDSGETLRAAQSDYKDALYRKPHSASDVASQATLIEGWVVFPWETNGGGPTEGIQRLIEYIGEDPNREGLLDTPQRVLKAFREMTTGYDANAADILGTTFDVGKVDEMIVVRNIEFVSLCEHHMLPFTGTAAVGYVPSKRVVGLSKIARLVDMYSRRLQVQERLTQEITGAIDDVLEPLGAACVIEAAHSCMGCRGVRKPSARMITSSLTGVFREPEVRSEFLSLAQ